MFILVVIFFPKGLVDTASEVIARRGRWSIQGKGQAARSEHQQHRGKLNFTKPVYAGDEINIWVTLDKVMPKRNRARLATLVENQEGQTVLRGMAEIIPPLRNAA